MEVVTKLDEFVHCCGMKLLDLARNAATDRIDLRIREHDRWIIQHREFHPPHFEVVLPPRDGAPMIDPIRRPAFRERVAAHKVRTRAPFFVG
jgi:hypothetical protein